MIQPSRPLGRQFSCLEDSGKRIDMEENASNSSEEELGEKNLDDLFIDDVVVSLVTIPEEHTGPHSVKRFLEDQLGGILKSPTGLKHP
jgi:hypothetical protein